MSAPVETPSLLVIGCGDLGTGVAEACLAQGWRVWGVRRTLDCLPAGIEGIAADVTRPETLAPLAAFAPDFVLVTLTPGEFTDGGYQSVYVEGLRNLLGVLRPPRRLVWVSSTSVYHQDGGEVVDETSPTQPEGFSGQRLLEAEQLLATSGWTATVVRLAGIYGPHRSRLLCQLRAGKRSPANPVRISNRIHRDDAVGLLYFLLGRAAAGVPLARCYLGVDAEPAPIATVETWFAQWLGLPDVPASAEPLLRGGNRYCSSARLQALGYRFLYPTYREGLPTLVGPSPASASDDDPRG